MYTERFETPSAEALGAAISGAAAHGDSRGLLVLLAAEGLPPAEVLDPILAAAPLPLLGGVFPSVIMQDRTHDRGGIVIGLPVPPRTALIQDLSRADHAFTDQLEAAFGDDEPDGGAIITFYDATSSRVDSLLAALFDRFGLFGSYLGGGAGALSFARVPCVFTREGMVEDAAVVGLLDLTVDVGVAHGWQAISEPMHVTGANGRSLRSLDDRPAVDVYQRLVEAHAREAFDPDDFFALARSYPLGIVQLDGERVIRDPLFIDDDGITCAGEIPEGAFVQLLHGNEASLLAAAGRAAAAARSLASDGQPSGLDDELVLVFDCISRVIYLGERFREELALIDAPLPRVGAATIGEVCNPGDRYLEVYNKTIVVARTRASTRSRYG